MAKNMMTKTTKVAPRKHMLTNGMKSMPSKNMLTSEMKFAPNIPAVEEQPIPEQNPSTRLGMAKGGSVCRGGGAATRGTKFSGVK